MSRPSRVEGGSRREFEDLAGSDPWARLVGAWVGGVARRAPWVLLLAALVTVASLLLAHRQLVIDTDTTNMIAEDVPFRRHDTAFQRVFPKLDDALVIVIDGGEPEAAAGHAEALAARLRASPHFESVYWPSGEIFLRRNGFLYMEIEALEALADRLAAAEPLLGALAREPSLAGLLKVMTLAFRRVGEAGASEPALRDLAERIADVGEAAAVGRPARLSWRRVMAGEAGDAHDAREIILARPRLDTASLAPARVAMAEVRALARQVGIGPSNGTRLRLTGTPAMRQEELESAKLGGTTAGLLSLGLVALLLGLGLRAIRLVIATLVTLLMGLSWSAGFATLAVGHLNLLSVAFAVLFIGLAVDFSIHFCLRFREELAEGDGDERAALVRAARGVARGLAIAALAAGLGFFAFLPTDYRGFAELGLISGVSMGLAYVANLTVLPALLALLPGRPEARWPHNKPWRLLEHVVTRHHRSVLVVSLAAMIVALFWLPRVGFDLNPVNLRDPESESVATFLELSADPEASPYAVDILAPDLASAVRLALRLERSDEVRRSLTLASFVPSGQEEKLTVVEEMAFYLAPLLALAEATSSGEEDRVAALRHTGETWAGLAGGAERAGPLGDSIRRASRAFEILAARGPEAVRDLEHRLLGHFPRMIVDLSLALRAAETTVEAVPDALRARWVGVGDVYRIRAAPTRDLMVRENLKRFVDAVSREAPDAVGSAITVSGASEVVIEAFLIATALAVVAIAILLVAVHRRFSLVLLTLAPLALAAGFTLAGAAAIGLDLNFANVITLPLLFGLGVASNIHVVERLGQLADPALLMRTTTPRAVLFSTLTTLASFGSLAISAHRGMASMGELLTIAILFTLICTLLILPSLVPLVAPNGARAGPAERKG